MSDKPYIVYMLRSKADPTLYAKRGAAGELVPFHRAKLWRTAGHAKQHLSLTEEYTGYGFRHRDAAPRRDSLELVPFLLTPLEPLPLSEPLAEEAHDDE